MKYQMTLYMGWEIYSSRWRHQMETFSASLAFVWGIHRGPVNSRHKGQWCGALMFYLICVWINDWVNNNEAGDLRRYRANYDVTVMQRGNSHEIMPPYLTWPIAPVCCAERQIQYEVGSIKLQTSTHHMSGTRNLFNLSPAGAETFLGS